MLQDESIYSIIKPEYEPIQKRKHYSSKYAPDIPPTGSTFGNHTTSRPRVANLSGSLEQLSGPHNHKGHKSYKYILDTFGTKKGEIKPEPSNFMKKGKLA